MTLEQVRDMGIAMGRELGREGGQRKPEADSCLEHREDPKPQPGLKEGERAGEERGGLGCIPEHPEFQLRVAAQPGCS